MELVKSKDNQHWKVSCLLLFLARPPLSLGFLIFRSHFDDVWKAAHFLQINNVQGRREQPNFGFQSRVGCVGGRGGGGWH